MGYGFFELLQEVDRRIAKAKADMGFTGSTLDAGAIGGALPPTVIPDLAGDASGPISATVVEAIQGVAVDPTDPTAGQVLTAIDADSAEWADPTAVAGADHGALTGLGDDDHKQYQLVSEGLPSIGNPPAAQGGLYSLLEDPDGPVTLLNNSAHNAFPSLTQMADGRLVVVYRAGTSHVGDKGTTVMRVSSDLGRTWSSATTVHNDATYDSRVGAVARVRGGRLLVALGKYNQAGSVAIGVGWTTYSDDNGVAWSTPAGTNSAFTAPAYAMGPAVQLPDGTLLMPLYGRNSGNTFDSSRVVFSTDNGESWGGEITIANGQTASRQYSEPQIVRLLDGTLYCLMRSDTASQMWAAISIDDGATWGAAASKFSGTGKPALTRLGDGTLVCIYRKVSNNDAVYRISADDGATWGSETTLDVVGAGFNMTYAGPYELDDAGGVLAVAWGVENAALTDSDLFFTYLYRGNTISPLSGDYLGLPVDPDTDELVKVSSNDTTPGYLGTKLVAGARITLTEVDDGSDETLEISADAASVDLTQLHEHVIGEDLTAETNSAKVTFLTANEFEPESLAAYLNGARQRPVTDYTEDAGYQSITFAVAPTTADELILDYVAA